MAVALKICGVVSSADVEACAREGVELVGLNLWPGSRRGLSLDEARRLVDAWPEGGPGRVGVFVDPEPEAMVAAARELGLDAVQPHGDAPIERYAGCGLDYVWVIRGTPELGTLSLPKPRPRWVLLDAHVRGYGGAGARTDWDWARAAVDHFDGLAPEIGVWLAGGIDPSNAEEAIARVGPAGLDVASGAEPPALPPGTRAGTKDPERIAALAAICKNRG